MADKIQWAGNTMPKSDDKHLGIMSLDHVKKARAFHQSFPQYTVTPLARLDGQAARGWATAELPDGYADAKRSSRGARRCLPQAARRVFLNNG